MFESLEMTKMKYYNNEWNEIVIQTKTQYISLNTNIFFFLESLEINEMDWIEMNGGNENE